MTETRAKYLDATENIMQSDVICLGSAAQSLSSHFFPRCFHTFYFHNKQQMSPELILEIDLRSSPAG